MTEVEKKKEAKISFTIIFFSFDTIDTKLHCSQLQSLHGTTLGYNEEVLVAVSVNFFLEAYGNNLITFKDPKSFTSELLQVILFTLHFLKLTFNFEASFQRIG